MAAIKRKRRRRKPRQKGRPSKYRPEYCETALELGRRGWGITEAANYFGVVASTFSLWEKRYPDFKQAAKRIRENSRFWARWRSNWKIDRLAEKEENHLVEPLYRVRQRRMAHAGTIEDLRKEFGVEKIEVIPNAKRVTITAFTSLQRENDP